MRALRITADVIAMSRAQWMKRLRLEALQSRRLRAIVAHAHATVPLYRVQQWRRLADSLRWPLHDVRTSGAFVMQW